MKTTEEKAKAYDESLERARDFMNGEVHYALERGENIMCWIFPELKESEDEKIRKGIIDFLWKEKIFLQEAHSSVENNPKYRFVMDAIAWLEKQGEHTDKVEPKFQNGQWIVWQNKCYKVNYNGCGYELVDQNGLSTSLEYGTIDENAHLWDITKDAKNGDVLVASDGSLFIFAKVKDNSAYYHFSLCKNGSKEISDGNHSWETANSCHPATKEQRDQLEKAMTNAGWEFDFDKKELKKIEQKFNIGDEIKTANEEPLTITKIDEKGYWSEDLFICGFDDTAKWEVVGQKTAWSEEDKRCEGCNNAKGCVACVDGSEWAHIEELEKQGEQNHCMIQWKGDNLKEVIDFTGKDKNFEKWFKSFEEYEKYVQEHDGIFKLFNADGSHYEVPVGAWIVKTPDGYNVASKAVFKQKSVDTPKFKVEQTSTWSEDDKDLMYNTLSNLTELKDRYGEGYGKVGKCIDWLKSLKERVQPQNTWKPSGEQILALRWILNNIPYNRHKEEISGLLEQLKKLKE